MQIAIVIQSSLLLLDLSSYMYLVGLCWPALGLGVLGLGFRVMDTLLSFFFLPLGFNLGIMVSAFGGILPSL